MTHRKLINPNQSGFTLIELLVVIAIIAVLLTILLASLDGARQRARIATAKSQLHEIKNGMEIFFASKGDYPPVGEDHCDACKWNDDLTPYIKGKWQEIVDDLVAAKSMSGRIDKDPWGNEYGYDKNWNQPCPDAWSIVCSAGPNGIIETNVCQEGTVTGGDDICFWIPDNDLHLAAPATP